MPPLDEGTLLYMPIDAARHLDHRGAAAAPDPGPDPQAVSRGRARVRQGRPRGDGDRSRAAVDDRDHHHAEAGRVAQMETWYSSGADGPTSATPDLAADWSDRDERGAAAPGVANAWTMPIKDAHRHAHDRHPDAGRHQDLRRPTSTTIEQIGTEIESAPASVPGTRSVFAERTAGGYFLDFDWKRDELARYGLTVGRRADGRLSGDRRRERDDHRRGPRALPVNVRYTRDYRERRRTARAHARSDAERRAQIPLSAARRHPAPGPGMIAQRERSADRLRLRRRRRARRRRLRRRRQAAVARAGRSCRPATRSSGAASTKRCERVPSAC